jgi:hypothetical protein
MKEVMFFWRIGVWSWKKNYVNAFNGGKNSRRITSSLICLDSCILSLFWTLVQCVLRRTQIDSTVGIPTLQNLYFKPWTYIYQQTGSLQLCSLFVSVFLCHPVYHLTASPKIDLVRPDWFEKVTQMFPNSPNI